ncbi:MAG: hypothetical protein B2I17_08410 [Thermoplasmatales archaeon B_DKE]|nr:MAG: hypothetical protein B2I17_08410 [Thermoplasmatales archaeon B_DKE]
MLSWALTVALSISRWILAANTVPDMWSIKLGNNMQILDAGCNPAIQNPKEETSGSSPGRQQGCRQLPFCNG